MNDLRFGFRMLVRRPGLTAAVGLTLALAIAVNAVVFSLVNSLLFRPPGVHEPARLVEIFEVRSPSASVTSGNRLLSYPDYLFFRDHNEVFSGLLGEEGDLRPAAWNHAGYGEIIHGKAVSADYFSVLGIQPALGRDFRAEEDREPGAHPVMVLAHDFWQRRLDADPQVIGKMLTVNGSGFTVVGVAPAGFSGIIAGFRPDFWVPTMMAGQIGSPEGFLARHDNHWVHAVGRLKPGVTRAQAQANLELLAGHLAQTFPDSNREWTARAFPASQTPAPLRAKVSSFSGVLLAAAAGVLLIACANTTNVFLARAIDRRSELTIRLALGAGRFRLMRQLVAETLWLAALGGGLAVLLTAWAAPLLARWRPPMPFPIRFDLPLDWRVLGFIILLILAAGLVLGVLPAVRGPAPELASALKAERAGAPARSQLRGSLIAAQVTVCYVLLIGAGLCLRSGLKTQSADPGFEVDQRIVASLDLRQLKCSPEKGRELFRDLLARVSHRPGIQSVSLAAWLPLGLRSETAQLAPDADSLASGEQARSLAANRVGPGYFRTMGIPVLRGREFGFQDGPAGPAAVVVNEALAHQFWPGGEPIGRRLDLVQGERIVPHEIVGVVKTTKNLKLSEAGSPTLYLPFLKEDRLTAVLVAHSAGAANAALDALRVEVQAVDPRLALNEVRTLRQHIGVRLFPARVTRWVLGSLAVLALAQSIVGLYGIIACSVSQRTREIAIRKALGAQTEEVLRLVVGQGMRLVLVGMGVGLLVALGLTRFLSSFLYGLSPFDPLTFGGVSLTLLIVALVGCYLPARRATRIDPVAALRCE